MPAKPWRRDPQLESLVTSSLSETTPWLLELLARHAARRRPRDLLAQWRRDSFVAPSHLDQRTIWRLDGWALDSAPEYEALQLSPVAPLAVCSVVAPTSQHRVLSALRGTEVVSSNHRQRFVAAGFGLQLLAVHFEGG